MEVRIFFAGQPEVDRRERAQTETLGLERLMLSGDDQVRRQPARRERMGDGREFDGFGPGADDQPDVGDTQTSPLARRAQFASTMERVQASRRRA